MLDKDGGIRDADGIIAKAVVLTGRKFRKERPAFRTRAARCADGTRDLVTVTVLTQRKGIRKTM